LKLVNESR